MITEVLNSVEHINISFISVSFCLVNDVKLESFITAMT